MRRGRRQNEQDLGRAFRLREAAAIGLRVVPARPDPREFPARAFGCDLRPRVCGACGVREKCPFGFGGVRS